MIFIKKIFPLFFLHLVSCSNDKTIDSNYIIEKSISVYGWDQNAYSIIFDFREYQYKLIRKPSFYSYQRSKVKDGKSVFDIMTSKIQLQRYQDSIPIKLKDSIINLYSNSLNSVMYFFQLPGLLKDNAVVSELLGTTKILDKNYWTLRVGFKKFEGGKDFQDEYRYWIDQNNYQITFFAYNYLTDGGGVRFREAKNIRKINGFLFQDYDNYKPKNKATELDSLPKLFEKDSLLLISEIKNKNIKVEIL